MKNFLIGLVLILVSCNGQKKTIVKNSDNNSKDSSLVLLLQDEYSGFDTEETMVIKDQKRLKSFYSKINMTRKPGLSLPSVDFSKEMVVIRCSGNQNYNGRPILAFNDESDTQVILDSKIEKNSGNASSSLRSNLFCVYKMPLTDKEIVVKKDIK